MIPIKDYENEFTVLQAEKAIELMRGLLEASEPAMDLLKDIDMSDVVKFTGVATTKTAQAEKKRLEAEYEAELTKRLIEKHGMFNIIKAQSVNKLQKVNPRILAKFGALIYKRNDKENYSEEIYNERLIEFENMSIKKLNELEVKKNVENFLKNGISGIMDIFQISATSQAI